MRGLPYIGYKRTSRLTTDTFGGWREGLRIGDGEWSFTENLTSSAWPMLAARAPRGLVRTLTDPGGLLEKDALALVDNGTLYYNGLPTGLIGLSPGEKQLVSMGAYLCIWPDKKYFNTADFTDYGNMEASYSSSGSVQFSLCRSDGTEYESVTRSDTEPTRGSCEVWIDSSGNVSVAMEWSTSAGGWVQIPTVFTKLRFTSHGEIPALFAEGDGVHIEGADFEEANGEKILYAVGGAEGGEADFVVIVGLLDESMTQQSGSVKIERTIPPLDFVCECQNRLWGCYYGNDGERNLNEIYCCALGDFKNWRQYRGLSTDAWTASVGSDGQWTGAVNYLGRPVFFKENRIHLVTPSSVGAHQVDELVCRGVQKGSHKSLQVVNETLFYKSRVDICAWQGGFPETASAALGEVRYYDAVAGAFGQCYYVSMRAEDGNWHLFVYDIRHGFWLREDDLHALCFAKVDDELYAIDADSGALWALRGTCGTPEEAVGWQAVSGVQYYETADRKYLSRYNIKLRLDEGASVTVYLEYDGSGDWVQAGAIENSGLRTVLLPVRPRRCDHMRMKLVGTGGVKIFSITRVLEVGSDE